MDVSSQDPPLMAMDLSKGFPVNPLTRSHAEAMDLAKKPEWYHRRLPSCSTEVSSPFGSRASSLYNSTSAPLLPEPSVTVRHRDVDPLPESLGDYMNSSLTRGLDLYHDGVHGNLWHSGFYGPDQTGGPVPESSGGEESDSGSDVIFLVSSAKEPLLCSPFIQDGHMVAPLSPAVSSLEDGGGCYHLPQPLSSPSPDSSYSEDSSDSSGDIPVHHTRPIVLLSDLSAVYSNPADSPDISSDDSDVIKVSVTTEKRKSNTFPRKRSAVRDTPPQSESEKAPPREIRRSTRFRKPVCETPPFTCSASRRSLRRRAKKDAVGIYNESWDSDDVIDYAVRLSSSDSDAPLSNVSRRASANSEDCAGDGGSPQSESKPRHKVSESLKRRRKKPPAVRKTKRFTRTELRQNSTIPSGRGQRSKSATPVRRRRKRRRSQTGPAARFSPREPEIQLRYAKIKEEKKEKKAGSFCPFVHMEKRSCTVVNCQEEETTVRVGRRQTASASLCGYVPNTSCFQLGRSGSESRCEAALLCCLCGQTANAVGLGDLHGPYQPAGPTVDCQKLQQREVEQSPVQSHAVNTTDERCDGRESSLPTTPRRLRECWIHEDCGIWSAGVFLVRGKLYGLEEAARLAQETACSVCQQTGAIMGCFQKGCLRSYHFRCAVQSGCVLNEDNFSIRCPEHKNKLLMCVNRRHKR